MAVKDFWGNIFKKKENTDDDKIAEKQDLDTQVKNLTENNCEYSQKNDINDIDEKETQDNNKVELASNITEAKSEKISETKPESEKSFGLFGKLKQGLKKTGQNFNEKLGTLFKSHIKIDDDLYEEIEEILITSDISFETTINIVERLKQNIKEKGIADINQVYDELKSTIYDLIKDSDSTFDVSEKTAIVVVGVNGVGKTTTIGKLALKFKSDGKSVLLAAGDTFRAAAQEQLEVWAERVGTSVVSHSSGADPSAVIFDAIHKAKSQNTDVLICDTAGRLHNKKNLMNELEKIVRTINKEYSEAKKYVLLVIDATTGQNALNQVKTFGEVAKLDGVVLTKLDGTAKGGIVISVIDEFKVPVKFVGVGEKVDDLQVFDAKNFIDAIFDR